MFGKHLSAFVKTPFFFCKPQVCKQPNCFVLLIIFVCLTTNRILSRSTVQHSSLFVFSSLTINDTLLSVTSLEEAFQLSIHDDDVALEAPEAIILELSVYNQASCSLLNLTPFNQTQITIVDNDGETL